MPDDMNTEIARALNERAIDEADEQEPRENRHEKVVEILEAVLLAVVAIATAWSGYQAAKWDGENAASTRSRQETGPWRTAWTLRRAAAPVRLDHF